MPKFKPNTSAFRMGGYSYPGTSPIQQDDKRKCYINEKGESICPYAPMAEETPEIRKKWRERGTFTPSKTFIDIAKKKEGLKTKNK